MLSNCKLKIFSKLIVLNTRQRRLYLPIRINRQYYYPKFRRLVLKHLLVPYINDVIQFKWVMIDQYTFILSNGKMYTGISWNICIICRHFILGTLICFLVFSSEDTSILHLVCPSICNAMEEMWFNRLLFKMKWRFFWLR